MSRRTPGPLRTGVSEAAGVVQARFIKPGHLSSTVRKGVYHGPVQTKIPESRRRAARRCRARSERSTASEGSGTSRSPAVDEVPRGWHESLRHAREVRKLRDTHAHPFAARDDG